MATAPSQFPADLQQFLDDQIARGIYPSAIEVVYDAVRMMRDREQRLVSLRSDIERGVAEVDAGDFIDLTSEEDIHDFFKDIELRAQIRKAERPDDQ
jgi:putative addiction module CopG family antidote